MPAINKALSIIVDQSDIYDTVATITQVSEVAQLFFVL